MEIKSAEHLTSVHSMNKLLTMGNEAGFIRPMGRQYEDCLQDESRRRGTADEICFPDTREALAAALDCRCRVTLQGACTGLDGGAVPHGGRVVSLRRMDRILSAEALPDGGMLVTAEAGVSMSALSAACPGHFFAPAPTEPTATVGGVIACDARGVFADYYGGVAEHVLETETLRFGEGREAIVSAVLRLLPRPQTVWGVAFLFQDDAAARAFCAGAAALSSLAVNEYLDGATLESLARLRQSAQRLKALPETGGAAAMIYTELHAENEDAVCADAEALMALSADCGCAESDSWALCGEAETQLLRDFRHAAQESVHAAIDRARAAEPALYAPGADIWPDAARYEAFMAEARAPGTPCACFGHLCGGRMRLCFMPEDMDMLRRAESFLNGLRERGGV